MIGGISMRKAKNMHVTFSIFYSDQNRDFEIRYNMLDNIDQRKEGMKSCAPVAFASVQEDTVI